MADELVEKKNSDFSKGVYEWVEELVLAIVLVVVLFSFIFRVVTVNGNSMLPNYDPDDRLIVSALSNNVTQGDVVVIVDALDNPIIKRVIATEGQIVDIDNQTGKIYVDGIELDNTKFGVENGITFTDNTSYPTLTFPQTVPADCVFVLGDNRVISEDSRYVSVGMVNKGKILGTSVLRIFPLNRIGITD